MKSEEASEQTHSSVFFTDRQKEAIKQAILLAEGHTSGEIKVHIEPKCAGDVLTRAAHIFEKLRMHKTDQRNGVLFYLAYEDRRFAIFGDAGINAAVPENFWDMIKVEMQLKFRGGQFTEGLVEGIKKAGAHLAMHFPLREGDVNELENDISFG
jgi:uncharacterized membrane protein